MTSTSRKLTETLKKARKEQYITDMHDIATFAFAWKWPQHVDWGMTNPYARYLYGEISRLIDEMNSEGKSLTACQQRLLTD